MFKYRIPVILQRLFPGYTWKVDTQDKQLFLTFDDGPHPEITLWVLNLLKAFEAKATFFCVADNVRKYPEVYARILAEGHATGNHTYHHLRGWKTPVDKYLDDVKLAEAYIQGSLFRPPYGRIKPSQARALRPHYRLVMWSHLSRDYDPLLSVEESLQAMMEAGPGSVMVFHDSEKAFANLQQLLPVLLTHFRNKGYTFHAIPPRLS